ncbi:alpha/beta hydrolase [Leucobacter aridicollis]|uniref:alpha/beta hydrolase n=1 Tax=Leucobacter aridicollis TaxID=283878 RepID=UPI002102EAC0|nr:alpha/beta hydrolase [Leucobacter aridicollis]UTX52901.1 alpha/beta hydrolase [Leucobacter aridicollis]
MPIVSAIVRLIELKEADVDYARPGAAPVAIEDARRFHEADIEAFAPMASRDAVAAPTPAQIPGPFGLIPARLYRPVNAVSQATLVWYHGGGWVTGSIATADALVRALCARARVAVLVVDYALAPEHPWPAALNDATAALHWACEHRAELGGEGPVIVGGDSAGGNLAAILAVTERESAEGQVLLYPVVDLDVSPGRYPSRVENGVGCFVEWADIVWAIEQYLPDGTSPDNPLISPIASSRLATAAPAIIAAAEYDPLRDENRAYAARLAAAGVEVDYLEFAGLVHGSYDMMSVVPEVDTTIDEISDALGALVASLRAEA